MKRSAARAPARPPGRCRLPKLSVEHAWSRSSHCLISFQCQMVALDIYQDDHSYQDRSRLGRFSRIGINARISPEIRLCLFHGRRMGNVLSMAVLKTGFVLLPAAVSLVSPTFPATGLFFLSTRYRTIQHLVTLTLTPIRHQAFS